MTDQYVDEDYEDGFDDEDVPEEDYDYYSEEDLGQEVEKLRPQEIEGRTSWTYLGFLLALFVVLIFFSWACDDRSSSPGEPQTAESSEVINPGTPVQLRVVVAGDIVTLSGTVPDEAARQQILVATQERYGAENVIDELQVDENTTFDGGAVALTGSADVGDGRPAALREAITSGFGLSEGEFTIESGQTLVDPVSLEAQLLDDRIAFVGTVPDDTSVVDLIAAGEAVWGSGSVDTAGLALGDSTWTDAAITIVGTVQPGDTRLDNLTTEVQNRFGAAVTIDSSGVVVDQSETVLADIEEDLQSQLDLQPILFAPQSIDIDPVSDAVLIDIAATLNLVPDVLVEVVGHTDSAGDPDENQVLSEQRAAAVIDRLADLGVDRNRLSALGLGDTEPAADNGTAEGREQNRRIEFRLSTSG